MGKEKQKVKEIISKIKYEKYYDLVFHKSIDFNEVKVVEMLVKDEKYIAEKRKGFYRISKNPSYKHWWQINYFKEVIIAILVGIAIWLLTK